MITSIDSDWTLFLDRDGVINERNFDGYITDVKDFKFKKGSLEAIVGLRSIFSRIIIVTNQQGVGKKIMSLRNVKAIHRYMEKEVESHGGKIDAILVATCLKSQTNNRRKPNPNMAIEAKELFPEINFEKSIMVGDTDSDIKFGTNIGMKTVLIKSKEVITEKADWEVNSLLEFYQKIKTV